MPERNICHDHNCYGFCCQDLDMVIKKQQLQSQFPQAQEVTIDDIKNLDFDRPGIWYCFHSYSGTTCMVYVRINGPCPHLSPNGGCDDWQNRPDACENVKVGDPHCNDVRGFEGLSIIPLQDILINDSSF